MILNSTRGDDFNFYLPSDILPDDIEKQYNQIFIHQPTQLINSMSDLLYDSIQNINLMAFNAPIVKQTAKAITDANGIKKSVDIFQRGSKTVHQTIDKRIVIRHRLAVGAINYFALLESYLNYHNDKSTKGYYEPMRYIALYNKKPMFGIDFSDCIFAAIDKLEFDATNIDTSEKTFTTTWVFNNINFRLPSEILKA